MTSINKKEEELNQFKFLKIIIYSNLYVPYFIQFLIYTDWDITKLNFLK